MAPLVVKTRVRPEAMNHAGAHESSRHKEI